MKRLIICLMMVFFVSGIAYASMDAVYQRNKNLDVVGWSVHVEDDDLDSTLELVTELDTTYAQLSSADDIEAVSSDSADITQTVTLKGVNSAGKYVTESFALNSVSGDYGSTSDTVFLYLDQASLDAECAGTITIRSESADTFITSIPIGQLEAGMAQHFNGEKNSYISGWKATALSSPINYQIRWYPDDADSLDASDGYKILDRINTGASTSDTVTGIFAQPIRCPAGGWIAVYGRGTADNLSGSVTIQGYDSIY